MGLEQEEGGPEHDFIDFLMALSGRPPKLEPLPEPIITIKRDKAPAEPWTVLYNVFVNGLQMSFFAKDKANGYWQARGIVGSETWLTRWQARSAAVDFAVKRWRKEMSGDTS